MSGQGIASVWPPPPPYYREFKDAAVAELKEVLERGDEVPEPLQALLPPEPPSEDAESYRGFGAIWNIHEQLVPLNKVGVPQLYDDSAVLSTATLVKELRKLLGSVLVKFLGLVTSMCNDPEQYAPVVEDLRVLLINMHHLLNTYRPLQSKESLVLRMREQVNREKQRAADMRAQNSAIEDRINMLAARLPQLHQSPSGSNQTNPDWAGLDLD